MEIIIKNADFSANAVTKLTTPFTTFLNGCYLSDGSFSSKNKYYHSLGVVAISEDMRSNGFVIQNMQYINSNDYPLVIFFNSSSPSTSSFVDSIFYKTGSLTTYKVYPEQIPETATHFVVNIPKANNDGKVFENYFIPVVDEFTLSNGYIANNGTWQADDTHRTTQMIAVNAGEPYLISGNIISTYDIWGNFIERFNLSQGLTTFKTFSDGVSFVRLSYLISSYMHFEY